MTPKKIASAVLTLFFCGTALAQSQINWNKDPMTGLRGSLLRITQKSRLSGAVSGGTIRAAFMGVLRGDWENLHLASIPNAFDAARSNISLDSVEWEQGRANVYVDVSGRNGSAGAAAPETYYCVNAQSSCATYVLSFSQFTLRPSTSEQGYDVFYKGHVVGRAAAKDNGEPDEGVVDVAFVNGYKLKQAFGCPAGQTAECALSVFLEK